MVNDAVAIILFKVVGGVFDDIENGKGGDTGIDAETIFKILWQFCYTVVVSLFIGSSIALLSTYLFKKFRFLVHSPIC